MVNSYRKHSVTFTSRSRVTNVLQCQARLNIETEGSSFYLIRTAHHNLVNRANRSSGNLSNYQDDGER